MFNNYAAIPDNHFHYNPDYNYQDKNGTVRNLLLMAAKYSLRYCLETCREEGVDTVVFLGDYNELKDRQHNFVRNAFIGVLETYNDLKKVFITGNHDWDKAGHCNVLSLSRYGRLIKEPCIEGGVAYVSYKNWDTFFDTAKDKVELLFGHFPIKGFIGMDNGITLNDLDSISDSSIVGHIHEWKLASKKTLILGDTYQLDWGENRSKVFYISEGCKNVRPIKQFFDRQIIPVMDIKDIDILKAFKVNYKRTILRLDITSDMFHYMNDIKEAIPKDVFKVFYNYIDVSMGISEDDILLEDSKDPDKMFVSFVNAELNNVDIKKRKMYRKVIEKIMR
jgi:calcineurin-like phosphoesterase family protein